MKNVENITKLMLSLHTYKNDKVSLVHRQSPTLVEVFEKKMSSSDTHSISETELKCLNQKFTNEYLIQFFVNDNFEKSALFIYYNIFFQHLKTTKLTVLYGQLLYYLVYVTLEKNTMESC